MYEKTGDKERPKQTSQFQNCGKNNELFFGYSSSISLMKIQLQPTCGICGELKLDNMSQTIEGKFLMTFRHDSSTKKNCMIIIFVGWYVGERCSNLKIFMQNDCFAFLPPYASSIQAFSITDLRQEKQVPAFSRGTCRQPVLEPTSIHNTLEHIVILLKFAQMQISTSKVYI